MPKKRAHRRHLAHRASGGAYVLDALEGRVLLSRATGIDVSQYQDTINWTQVAASGLNFAYIRATYGESSVDPDFVTNANAATATSLPIGFYHYAYYDLAGHTPALEAANFWGQVKSYYKANGKFLMPLLDIEEGSALGTGTGESSLSQWVEDWCTDITNDAAAVGLHIVPIVYCSSSPAGSYFDTTPPKTIPLWVADYYTPVAPQTDNPKDGTGKWQTWQLWQYSSTATVSGISTDVDADVLNGDTTTLKDYIVSSTTGTISAKYAINTTIQTTTGVNAYATLADAQNQTSNFTVVASGTVGTILSAPAYGGSYQRYKVTFKNGVTGYVAEDFMATAAAPAAVTLSSPANNAHLTAQPGSLAWTASPLATSYGVYLNGVLKTTTTATSYSLGTLADGTYTWQVKAINSQGTAAGSTDTFILDTTPPTATLPTQSPTGGASTFQFTVNYADATSGLNSSTLGNGNITVTGPNSFSQAATFVSYNSSTGVAIYQITAPGGIWNAAANGTYTVSQNASSVKDNYGNARPAGTIGTFIANTFAYLSGTTLIVDYGTTAGSMSLSPSGGNLLVQDGSNTDTFGSSSISAITVSGSHSGDTFTFSGPVTQPVTLNLSGGSGTVDVNAGTMSVANDVTTASPGLTLNVASGAGVIFTTNEQLASLNIDGGVVSLPNSSTITLTGILSVTDGGTFDIVAGQVIVNSSVTSEDTIRSYLAQAYDNGQWDGSGITSSMAATHPGTAIGYIAGNGSNGAPVGTTLLAYAIQGDTTLKGSVDFDDFNTFSNNYNQPGDWSQGDFDYSGVVDFSDFNLLSANYNETLSQLSGEGASAAAGPVASSNAEPSASPAIKSASAVTTASSPTVKPFESTAEAVVVPLAVQATVAGDVPASSVVADVQDDGQQVSGSRRQHHRYMSEELHG